MRGGDGMVYRYDGTLDGYLTCIYHHYYTEAASRIETDGPIQGGLFEASLRVETDSVLAEKVHRAIREKFSNQMYTDMHRAFLSCHPEKDSLLLRYIVLAFRMGRKMELLHTHEDVYQVVRISRRVAAESHRFLGILRFSDLGGFLYAAIEPDNNVLELLGSHFSSRYARERWVIHDVKRQRACVGSGGRWLLADLDRRLDAGGPGREEAAFRELWKAYFAAVAIEDRHNPGLQQHFVPLKYRKHMVEFREAAAAGKTAASMADHPLLPEKTDKKRAPLKTIGALKDEGESI